MVWCVSPVTPGRLAYGQLISARTQDFSERRFSAIRARLRGQAEPHRPAERLRGMNKEEDTMQQNVGGTDRTARFLAGTALLGGGLFTSDPRWRKAMLAGSTVALGTAVAGYCPANAVLGIDSNGD